LHVDEDMYLQDKKYILFFGNFYINFFRQISDIWYNRIKMNT